MILIHYEMARYHINMGVTYCWSYATFKRDVGLFSWGVIRNQLYSIPRTRSWPWVRSTIKIACTFLVSSNFKIIGLPFLCAIQVYATQHRRAT